MDNYFAQVPDDQETIIAQVVRETKEEWLAGHLPIHECDPCVREAVTILWISEVKTFVPLLATRRVRACIRAGACNTIDW